MRRTAIVTAVLTASACCACGSAAKVAARNDARREERVPSTKASAPAIEDAGATTMGARSACAVLAELPLAAPIELLGGHIKIRPLDGSGRPRSMFGRERNALMAQSPEVVAFKGSAARAVILASEESAIATEHFDEDVRSVQGSYFVLSGMKPVSTASKLSSARGLRLEPSKVFPGLWKDAIVGAALVAHPDGTVQLVTVEVPPEAAEADLVSCTALGARILDTIEPGEATVTRAAGARVIATMPSGKQLVLDAPEDVLVEQSEGDADAFYVRRVLPFASREPRPLLNVLFHESRPAMPQDPPIAKLPGRVLGRSVAWTRSRTSGPSPGLGLDVVVDSPRRPGEVMELWISAEDAKQLETMKRIAETMRIVDAL